MIKCIKKMLNIQTKYYIEYYGNILDQKNNVTIAGNIIYYTTDLNKEAFVSIHKLIDDCIKTKRYYTGGNILVSLTFIKEI